MLYQLLPTGQMLWIDLPVEVVGPLVDSGRDLAELDWRNDTDRTVDLTLVALAVRYGWVCATGLVLNAEHVVARFRGPDIRRIHEEGRPARQAVLQQNDAMDQVLPGWAENTREVYLRADESIAQAAETADDDLQDLIGEVPVRPALVDHWLTLGGMPYRED